MKQVSFFLIMIVGLALFFNISAHAAELSIGESIAVVEANQTEFGAGFLRGTPVFGANFFHGKFSQPSKPAYDPNYRIAIGDIVNIRFWGALDFQADLTVDTLGNIFIPQVGNIVIAGLPHGKLLETIEIAVRKRYNHNLNVYATLVNYQPVSIFVTGNVLSPGIYQGLSSDSILQFLDKAGGIDPNNGSFRNVRIVRNKADIHTLDLYSFLTDGKVETLQFQSGDSIVVDNRMYQIEVQGDVTRPFKFEFFSSETRLSDVLDLALPKPSATNVTVTRWERTNKKITKSYPIDDAKLIVLNHGDSINVETDHNSLTTEVTVTGEHASRHSLQLDRDVSLQYLLTQIKLTPYSEPTAIQVFRKSVAAQQKELLEAKLKELETLVLTSASSSKDEAAMRSEEAKLITEFIARARKVEPKGQIIIGENSDPSSFILENEDLIFIPRKSNVVLVQGEVSFPGAHTWSPEASALDYISFAGDFGERADKEKILIIRQNGQVIKCDSERAAKKIDMRMGDAILVMPKLEGKNLQLTKDITQILYQIAVSARVLLTL